MRLYSSKWVEPIRYDWYKEDLIPLSKKIGEFNLELLRLSEEYKETKCPVRKERISTEKYFIHRQIHRLDSAVQRIIYFNLK